jgi:pectin methylesterase-like acyl-CoA thioesterase
MKDTVKLVCKFAILWALLSISSFAGQAAHASIVVVGSCKPSLISFSTIQAAVNAAPAGSTIDVCPGTYPEQVTISAKSLTLIGVLAGTSDAVVLVPPSGGLTTSATDIGGGAVAAQIFVENSTGVTISHLTVDGNGNALLGCGTNLIGIYFKNSAGKTTDSVARNQILDAGDQGVSGRLGDRRRKRFRNPSGERFK